MCIVYFFNETSYPKDYYAVKACLKEAMMSASLEEEVTVVIVGDDVIQHPKVLHILHCILLTGYAHDILTLEDKCNLIEVNIF